MWGIVPAAGLGSRIQPLACSKELLPVGSRTNTSRPRAVSEYLIERMLMAGVTKICFVIAPVKSDILEYYGGSVGAAQVYYAVQPKPAGLCDAIFRAAALISPDEPAVVGLPDTIWFPSDGLCALGSGETLDFLLFPVERPEFFDAVVTDDSGSVREIQVKSSAHSSNWIWGAFKLSGRILARLYQLWLERERRDEYFGSLVNEYLKTGGTARGIRAGTTYVDVGTLDGYWNAIQVLREASVPAVPSSASLLL